MCKAGLLSVTPFSPGLRRLAPSSRLLQNSFVNFSSKFQNTFVSAEARRHLLALHRPTAPPPRPLRGDHRPKVQQVRPADELRNLRLALHPSRPLTDRSYTKLAHCLSSKHYSSLETLSRPQPQHKLCVLQMCESYYCETIIMGFNVFLVILAGNIVTRKYVTLCPRSQTNKE